MCITFLTNNVHPNCVRITQGERSSSEKVDENLAYEDATKLLEVSSNFFYFFAWYVPESNQKKYATRYLPGGNWPDDHDVEAISGQAC